MRDEMCLLLVDEDRAFCASATALLDRFDVQVAHTIAHARELAAARNPRVVVIDLELPDGDGIDVISALADADPDLPILIASTSSTATRILAAMRAGARGHLCKSDLSRLPRAIEDVIAGESPMSAGVARLLLVQLRCRQRAVVHTRGAQGNLTPREVDVVEALRNGMSYEEVGTSLGVATNTVRTYIRSVYDKLQVSSKTEAVLVALRRGWLA